MRQGIKWVFVLILATVTTVTIIKIMINRTKELERIQEDEKLTEIPSAGLLMLNSSMMKLKPWKSTLRLSPYVRPQQYSINLYPNIKQGSFVGSVNITIILDTAQSYIKLHSKGLRIKETKLNSSSVTAFSYPQHEFWVVLPNEELSAGEYQLQISFEGGLLSKIIGLYRSVYEDSTSHEKHFLATSLFQPTYARLAFPCFDEPQLKSKFKISLIRPSGNNYIALSNMNQESEELNVPTNGLTTVHFTNTVPMSTYLACFIVCDFKSLEPVKADQGFPLTVYAPSGQIENMKYAQHVGLKTINFYVNYFGIQYPLPKLDLITIPDDFLSGAMENWGLVTFRETKVLYNESNSSIDDQETIAFIVAHELAHMWFGNLVTMKWWNDLWLNEGFATYMKYKASQVVHPDWDVDTSFLIHSLQPVQYLDSKLSSHAIVQDVSDPQQISSMFDLISYSKGSSVIRMLEGLLGEDIFRIGVSAYLKRFEFNNAETDDLWTELQTTSQNTVNVKKLMDTWTRQAGFPVVSAIRNGTKLTLKQQRFLSDQNTNSLHDSSPYDYKWEIPITYTTSNNNTVHTFWLTKDEDSITIDVPVAEWIKLNHRQVGYYIINYTKSDWGLLNNLLKQNVDALSAADRSNLIHDAFILANSNYLPYGIALNMTTYLSLEHHYVPWDVAATNFKRLSEHLYQRPTHKHLEKYVQQLLWSIEGDFWNDSSDRNLLQRKFRGVIFKLGCSYGLPSFQKKAYELFRRFLNDKIKPHPDIRFTVYYYGMSQGNDSEWNKLWDLFINEKELQEKNNLMDALTASKETSILTRLLQNEKNESHVRSRDYLRIILLINRQPFGTQFVWDFLRENWQYFVGRFSLFDWQFGNLIPSVCSHFNTQEHIREMNIFFDEHPEAVPRKKGRKSVLEVVSNNIKWLEKHEASEELNVPTNGLTTVHFTNTVPMSTYLACFIVCDFKSLEPVKADQGFPLTVYAPSGQIENMKYAQHVGLKTINFYVNYFGIQYPLPKLDLITIPDDFLSGAMENWGLVTFRETKVLYNESNSSIDDQETIAFIVAHELAHMWFGNLVTMKWWNDLWLNEGFATYMKYKASQVVHPDWDVDTSFLIHSLQPVQYLDSKLSSHAIVQDVSDPQQISSMFDLISYSKGSSVIRMLEGLLGEDIFRIGVSAYLKRFEFNNAETDDLWTELQTTSQNTVNVKKLMDTWTRQAGFPVVSAIRNGTKLTLKQQRFLSDQNTNSLHDSSPYDYKWEIPITYTTSNNNTVHTFWLTKDEDSITIDVPVAEWIKLNHRQVGYYIINYTKSDWGLLNNLLKQNVDALSAADRSNLIHDAFILANSNYLPYGIALNMTTYLSLEHHYVPWDVAATNFKRLSEHLYQRPTHKHLEKYVQQLLWSIEGDFWNDSSDRNLLQRKFRGVIFKLGCSYGLPSFQKKAYELFRRFLNDKIKPHPDIRFTVYYYGMSQGNDSEWNKLWDLFINEKELQEKNNLMDALTASKETSILTRLLQNAKNESHVRSRDYLRIILLINRQPFGTQFVWDFLRENWQYFVGRFSLFDWQFGNLIPSVCSHFNTQEHIREMNIFFDEHPEAVPRKKGRKSVLEVVSNNIKWLEKHEAVISNWLINTI